MFYEKSSPLENLTVLVVSNDPEILDTVADELGMCLVHLAPDYETALQYLLGYKYDVVIFDVMDVTTIDLFKISISQKFPAIMLTADEVAPESLKKSIQMGAVFFFPRELLQELREFLEKLILDKWKPDWLSVFDRVDLYLDKYLGSDHQGKENFIKEIRKNVLEYMK
jgi:DNA-binding NtrC family response regulator